MKIVKLDEYEYESVDLFVDNNRYVATLVCIGLDSDVDSTIHDVIREITLCKKVFVDGRHFTCENYSVSNHDPVCGGRVLRLYLVEDKIMGGSINDEVS